MNNLAADRKAAGDVLEMMNEKPNKLIETEVGRNEGQMLPGKMDWVATGSSLDPKAT